MIEPSEPGHTHRLPRSLLMTLVIICVGLVVSIVLVSMLAVAAGKRAAETDHRLTALEQYVAGKGEQRDRENAEQTARLRQAVCDVLDQLPSGGLLDPVRHEYGCPNPGVAAGSLTPEQRQNLSAIIGAAPITAAPESFTPTAAPPAPGGSGPLVGHSATPTSTAPAPAQPSTATAPTVAPSRSVAPNRVAAPPTTATPTSATATPPPTPRVDLGPLTRPVCQLTSICIGAK